MRQLIINADGYGFTFGNNKGILESLPYQAIKSVSVNTNFPAVKEAVVLVRDFPSITIGVHWNLSVGRPVVGSKNVPSLVNKQGEFLNRGLPRRALLQKLRYDEMRAELKGQAMVLFDMGLKVTHWDSHQSRHVYPGFMKAAIEVARELGLRGARPNNYFKPFDPPRLVHTMTHYLRNPARIITHFLGVLRTMQLRQAGFLLPDYRVDIRTLGYGSEYRLDAWAKAFTQMPSGTGCIAVHPGYPDDVLRKYAVMTDSRLRELDLFKGDRLAEQARTAGVKLVGYEALSEQ